MSENGISERMADGDHRVGCERGVAVTGGGQMSYWRSGPYVAARDWITSGPGDGGLADYLTALRGFAPGSDASMACLDALAGWLVKGGVRDVETEADAVRLARREADDWMERNPAWTTRSLIEFAFRRGGS